MGVLLGLWMLALCFRSQPDRTTSALASPSTLESPLVWVRIPGDDHDTAFTGRPKRLTRLPQSAVPVPDFDLPAADADTLGVPSAVLREAVVCARDGKPSYEVLDERYRRFFPRVQGARVCELGPGAGTLYRDLHDLVGEGGQVYMVDIDRLALDVIAYRASLGDPRYFKNTVLVVNEVHNPCLPVATTDGSVGFKLVFARAVHTNFTTMLPGETREEFEKGARVFLRSLYRSLVLDRQDPARLVLMDHYQYADVPGFSIADVQARLEQAGFRGRVHHHFPNPDQWVGVFEKR